MVTFAFGTPVLIDALDFGEELPEPLVADFSVEQPDTPAMTIAEAIAAIVAPRFTCPPSSSWVFIHYRLAGVAECTVTVQAKLISGSVIRVEQEAPSAVIESAHRNYALPADEMSDFGFIAALASCVVKVADGRIVWDNHA